MDSARTKLIKGSVKSALAALTGVSGIGNLLEPDRFSLVTWHGIGHTLAFSAGVVLVAEGRYAYQWIKKWSESDGTLEEVLDTAQKATQQAGAAIEEAKDKVPPKV